MLTAYALFPGLSPRTLNGATHGASAHSIFVFRLVRLLFKLIINFFIILTFLANRLADTIFIIHISCKKQLFVKIDIRYLQDVVGYYAILNYMQYTEMYIFFSLVTTYKKNIKSTKIKNKI